MQEIQTLPLAQESSLDLREFGSVERLHWLMGQNHPNHFVMAAEVRGVTTVDMWREALDKLQRRHPLLNVCLGRNAESKLVFRQAAGHKIPLIVKRRISPQQWQTEFEREQFTPLYDSTPPLMRAILLEGADRCEIILTTHHTIADGMSLIFVIRDLLQALSGKKLEPLPFPPSQEERLAAIWTASPSPAPAPASSSNGNANPLAAGRRLGFHRREDGKPPRVHGLRLSQEQTSLLVEAARRESASVHTALCTALVLVGREISPLWRDAVRVLSPISLRKMLNGGEDCVLTTTATVVPFAPQPEMAFWDLARWMKQSLLPAQTLAGFANSRLLSHVLESNDDDEAISRLRELAGYELAVSNLQRVPFENKFGDLTLEAIWGPSALNGIEGEQLVGVATVNNSLCLVHTSYTPFDSFLEKAVDLAMKACANAKP